MSGLPRKAPDVVQEQRHTLGTFERAQIAEALALARRQQVINGVTSAVVPAIAGGAVIAAVVVGGNAYRSLKNGTIQEGVYKGFQAFVFGEEAANAAQADRKARGVSAFDDLISIIVNRRPARRGGDGLFSPR